MTMMNHKDVLSTAVGTLRDRAAQYGPEDQLFDRISRIVTVMLDKVLTPYDVAMIHVATKMARIASNPRHADNYVDGVNYMAFAAQFAGIQTSTAEEEEIAALARKFAPVQHQNGETHQGQPE
jgi:hypothetical protein